jgi:hypothetical protein
MYHPKMRGYMYIIVEIFPCEEGNGFRELHAYDNLEDTVKVLAVLEQVNWNFTCYGIMLRPVWDKPIYNFTVEGWDANGSPVI